MTVTLTWQCDSCGLTYERTLGGRGCLATPPGWTVTRIGDDVVCEADDIRAPQEYEDACPSCQPAPAEEQP
jgi:rubredoxin